MKKIENTFTVSGFVGKDAQVREFENASVVRFSVAVCRGEKDKDGKTQYTSAFISIEAWRKNDNTKEIDLLKKGTLVTVEGYFKPEEWEETNQETGEVTKRSRVVFAATKIYEPEEVEDKKD